MDLPTTVKVHFSVGSRQEIAFFRSDTPLEEIKDLFRSAAEAGSRDILKLYDSAGHLLNISSSLASNTPTTRYTLDVVAADGVAMLEDSLGEQFRKLEARMSRIERQLKTELPLPAAVEDLQRQVDAFRVKLETSESLVWLGFYKQLPEPLSSEECKRLQYRRKSDSVKKRVKENFANICESAVSDKIKDWIRQPTFDATPWEDEELLLLLQTMYLEYDLCSKFAIDIQVLRNFLYEAYKNYNDVPFHNFRHCFCVTQMMYAISKSVNLSSKIGDLEILILLTSCICHDLDHPGYNNIYQINAKTELAIRYNDISPLENHHCSVAFRILENDDCNIFKNFSMDEFKQIREGIIRCILATDMARHNEILTNFREISPVFDAGDKSHVNLLCMVLIKVSDISNEARPMDVAEPWLDKLLQEFFKQSDAEKLEGLPVTPFMDREKITKPSSQCSFIGLVLLPLFEALGELFPELQDFIVQPVRDALDYYKRLNEATREERHQRKSIVAELAEKEAQMLGSDTIGQNSSVTTSMPKSASNSSVKMIRKSLSFQQNRSRSRSTEDDTEASQGSTNAINEAPSLEDVAEDPESGDSAVETATEVEVSERALKFKISTEGSMATGRKSYPGSRKGSKERVQNLNTNDLARMVQRGRLRAGALSFDQQHCQYSKKLSCDPPEFLDEYAITLKKKFEDTLLENLQNSDDECVVSEETLNLNKRNSEHSVKTEESRGILKCTEKYSNAEKLKMNNMAIINDEIKSDKIEDLKDEEKQQLENKSRSFFSRLKQFTDRFSLSTERHQKSSKIETTKNNNYKMSSAKKKNQNKTCCKSLEDMNKASTLPKFKKGGCNKRGWKFLSGQKGKRLEGWASDADVDKLKTKSADDLDNESLPSSSQLSNYSSPKKTPDVLRSPKKCFLGSNFLDNREVPDQPLVLASSEKDPNFI